MSVRGGLAARVVLTVLAVAGLALDAYVHFDLASGYDAVRTSTLSQTELFRVEGVAATVAALALLVRPGRFSAVFAFLVAAGGLTAVLVYRYVDVGALGPFPSMYEPIWYPEKTASAYGEAVGAAAAAALVVVSHLRSRATTTAAATTSSPNAM